MSQIIKKTIELSEYSTKSPIGEFLESEDQGRFLEGDKELETLKLTTKDEKLKNYLKKKGILTIRELKKGIEVSSTSYIGVAQFSEFNVAIMPKILMNLSSLPKMIEYAYDLEDIIIPESEIKFLHAQNFLIEIIISSMIKKCEQILRQGLLKTYVTHQDDIPYLRGKLLLQKHFLNSAYKKLEFPCEFDELEQNNLENQILRYTLEICYQITDNESLKKQVRRLIHQFEGLVDVIPITSLDFNEITYTRINQHYRKIHQLCNLIIESTGISDFYTQKTSFVNSFFIDMNLIFESFVAKLFHKFYPLQIIVQKGKKAWVSDEGNSSNIRTDILTYDEGKVKSVIDTKYKKKISEADRFQIGFYIHEYKKTEGFAILPTFKDPKDGKIISENHSIRSVEQGITINVRSIDVDDTIQMLFPEDGVSKSKEIRVLLEQLVPSGIAQ